MITIFEIMTIAGLIYFSILLIMTEKRKLNLREKLEQQLKSSLSSNKMQQLLKGAGWDITAYQYNLVRYGTAILFLIYSYTSSVLREEPFSKWSLAICFILLITTSSNRISLTSIILKMIEKQNLIKKDGELISFLKLYQNNKRNKGVAVQFWAFCNEVSSHFKYIRRDLLKLSELIHEEGLENALDWFVNQYPQNHPFIYEIRSIILTTESNKDQQSAIAYLDTQNDIIADMSREQYSSKWELINNVSTLINAMPSILTMLMLVLLIVYYTIIIDGYSIIGF